MKPNLKDFPVLKHTVGAPSVYPNRDLTEMVEHYNKTLKWKERFEKEENWMNTPVKFWEIGQYDYNNFNDPNCIKEVIQWVKELYSLQVQVGVEQNQ